MSAKEIESLLEQLRLARVNNATAIKRASFHNELGHAYQQAGNYERAIYHHHRELQLSIVHHTKSGKKKRPTTATGDDDGRLNMDEVNEQVNLDCCKAYRFLGIAYSSAGRLRRALDAHEKSRSIAIAMKDMVEQQRTNHNYGETAHALYESQPLSRRDETLLDRGHEALLEAVRLADKISRDDTGRLIDAAAGETANRMRQNALYSLGSILDTMDQHTAAFASYAAAKRLTDHSEKASRAEREILAKLNSGMGLSLIAMGRYDEARVCLQMDLDVSTSLWGPSSSSPQPDKLGSCYNGLGQLEWAQGHYHAARDYYRRHRDLTMDSQGQQSREIAAKNIAAADKIIELEAKLVASKTDIPLLHGRELVHYLRRLLNDCADMPRRDAVDHIARQLIVVAQTMEDDQAIFEAETILGEHAASARPPDVAAALQHHQRALAAAQRRHDTESQLDARINILMTEDDDDSFTLTPIPSSSSSSSAAASTNRDGERIIASLNAITDEASAAGLLEVEHTALENIECIARRHGLKHRLPEFSSRLAGLRKRIKQAKIKRGEHDTDDDDDDDMDDDEDEFKGSSDDDNDLKVNKSGQRGGRPSKSKVGATTRSSLSSSIAGSMASVESDDDANELSSSSSDNNGDRASDEDVTDPDSSSSSDDMDDDDDDDDDTPLLAQARRAVAKAKAGKLRRLDHNGETKHAGAGSHNGHSHGRNGNDNDGMSEKEKKISASLARLARKQFKITRVDREAAAKKQAAIDAIENARLKRLQPSQATQSNISTQQHQQRRRSPSPSSSSSSDSPSSARSPSQSQSRHRNGNGKGNGIAEPHYMTSDSQEDMPIPFSLDDTSSSSSFTRGDTAASDSKRSGTAVASPPPSSKASQIASKRVVNLESSSSSSSDDDESDEGAFKKAARAPVSSLPSRAGSTNTLPSSSSSVASSSTVAPLQPFLDTDEDEFLPPSLPRQSHRRPSPSSSSKAAVAASRGEATETAARRSRLSTDEPSRRVSSSSSSDRTRNSAAATLARRRQQVSFNSVRGGARHVAARSYHQPNRPTIARRRRAIQIDDDTPNSSATTSSARPSLSNAIAARMEQKAIAERRDPLASRRALISNSGRPELQGRGASVIERPHVRQRYPIRRPRRSNGGAQINNNHSGLPRLLTANDSDDDEKMFGPVAPPDNDDHDDENTDAHHRRQRHRDTDGDANDNDSDDDDSKRDATDADRNNDGDAETDVRRSNVPQPSASSAMIDDDMAMPSLEPDIVAPSRSLPPQANGAAGAGGVVPVAPAASPNGPLLGIAWRISIDDCELFVRQLPPHIAASLGNHGSAGHGQSNPHNRDSLAWLITEAQHEYYRSYGRRPMIDTLMVDHADIPSHFPLSAIPSNADMSRPPILAMIHSWQPSSLSLYYDHLCQRHRHCHVNDGIAVWLRAHERVDPVAHTFTPLTRLVLPYHMACTPSNTIPFIWCLKEATEVTVLSMSHNMIGDECMDALAKTIARLSPLSLTITTRQPHHDRGLLKLHTLQLSSTMMTDTGVIALLPSLIHLPQLTTMDVSHNHITNASLPSLAQLISTHAALQHLNLSHTLITGDVDGGDGGMSFGRAFSASSSLQSLSFERTPLTCHSLSSMLKQLVDSRAPVTSLNLNYVPCMMHTSTMNRDVIASQSSVMDALRGLLSGRSSSTSSSSSSSSRGSAFGLIEARLAGWSDVCDRLSIIIQDAIEGSSSRLERLELRFNHMSHDATQRICRAIGNAKKLRVLGLVAQNALAASCTTSLDTALKRNKFLDALDVRATAMDDRGYQTIRSNVAAAAKQLSSLRIIDTHPHPHTHF